VWHSGASFLVLSPLCRGTVDGGSAYAQGQFCSEILGYIYNKNKSNLQEKYKENICFLSFEDGEFWATLSFKTFNLIFCKPIGMGRKCLEKLITCFSIKTPSLEKMVIRISNTKR
jgi:hypothetical protein